MIVQQHEGDTEGHVTANWVRVLFCYIVPKPYSKDDDKY
jgi:hypothetical protein